jgi:hypothetical protein
MLRASLLFIGVLACAPPPGGKDCPTRVAEVRALFAAGADDWTGISPATGMQLAESSRGGPLAEGIPVFVRADGSYEFEANAYADIAALRGPLADNLDKALTLAANLGRPASGSVLLVADARAPASAVVALTAAVPPEVRFALVVNLAGDIVPPGPPMPAAVQAALNVPAEARSRAIAELMTPAIGTCKALSDLFGAVATVDADQRGATLVAGLPAAIEQCNCEGLDLDTVISLIWNMSGKTAVSQRAIPLSLSGDPAAAAVTVPAGASFRDLVELVEARGAAPMRLVLGS